MTPRKAEYMREWRAANTEKRREYARAWRARNPDKVAANQRLSHRRNPAKMVARSKAWRDAHPERSADYMRQWGIDNRDKAQASARAWRIDNPAACKASKGRARARKRNAPINDFTAGEWLILRDEFAYCCAYCGAETPLSEDHMVALSKGGSHTYENIVPACRSCNSRKHVKTLAKYMEELMRHYGSYLDGTRAGSKSVEFGQ